MSSYAPLFSEEEVGSLAPSDLGPDLDDVATDRSDEVDEDRSDDPDADRDSVVAYAALPDNPVSVNTCASPPTSADLGQTTQIRHELRASVAAKLGLTLLSGDVSGQRLIVVQDYYRAAPCTTPSGATILYGTSVRLVIDVAGAQVKAEIGLPVIAAQVEMSAASARFRLDIRGYLGDLSKHVLNPGPLNVENYVQLMNSVGAIQQLLASDNAKIKPEPLMVELPETSGNDVERRTAIGTTFALSQIAEGRSLQQAREVVKWDSWSSEAQDGITRTYGEIVGGFDDQIPSGQTRAIAQSFLGRLRLRT